MLNKYEWIAWLCLLGACKIPRDTLLFSTEDLKIPKKVTPIPMAWSGRYLATGNIYAIGGDSIHRHAIPHAHRATSTTASQSMNPLGLSLPTNSSAHTHLIYSYLQHPYYSGNAAYQLRTAEVQASITRRGFNRVPKGIILLYAGANLPQGWVWCDGSNNTPDLRNVYIRIRLKDPATTPYGQNSHVHTTKHTHKWAVEPSDPANNVNNALAKDVWTYEGDTIALTVFSHIHGFQEEPLTDTLTQIEEILPPSLALNFIQATPAVRRIPKNALLPFLGTEKPWAWKRWPIASEREGSLLFGSSTTHPLLSWFGSRFHHHTFEHTHQVLLTSVPHQILSVSQNEGPAVARATHTHEVQAHLTPQTDSSASLPPYVCFPLLIKK